MEQLAGVMFEGRAYTSRGELWGALLDLRRVKDGLEDGPERDAIWARIDAGQQLMEQLPKSPPLRPAFGSPRSCACCGGSWAISVCTDMSGLRGYVCGRCAGEFLDGLGAFA